jgi:spermidine/putrescine transport system substrate-binding protein
MGDRIGAGGLSRREFLRRAAAAGIAVPSLAAILAACGGDDGSGATGATGSESKFARPDNPVTLPVTADNPAIADGLGPESGPLKIYGYSDYIWKKVRNRFADQYDVDIEYTVFDTPEEMVSKVNSDGASFDLIVSVTLENVGRLANGGLLQPLNKSYIPNFSNVWGILQDPYYDLGSQYTVPYTIYTTGIAWRNDLVSEDIASMDNPYDILWNTDYANQTHLLNGSRDLLATALLRKNEDVNTTDQQVLDQAKQDLLDGVDAMNWKFDHVDYNELGDWTIHETWSGQAVYYQYYLPKDLSIEQISYVWPPQTGTGMKGIAMNDVFAIPKGAASPVLAHTMIDFLLDPTNALDNYSYEGYQPPISQFDNEKVIADGLVPPNLENVLIVEDDLDQGVQELELSPEATQEYQQIYTEVTGGA